MIDLHITLPKGIPLQPVDLGAGNDDSSIFRIARVQAAWSVMVSGRPAADLLAWIVPIQGSTAGALRRELRSAPGSLAAEPEEEWLSTNAGAALRFRERYSIKRADHPLPLVTERVVWSWVIGDHLLIMAAHTLFLILAEKVFEVVDDAAKTMTVSLDE